MDDEPEVIRQHMDETRTALADKLGRLEQQVSDTVHDAVESVTSVKNAATETVENVRSAVQETVDSVRQSVKSTVDTVTDTLDIELQVQRHPWTMVAGAAAVGFAGGYLCYGEGVSEAERRTQASREKTLLRQRYASHECEREAETPRLAADRREREAASRPAPFNWLGSQAHALQPAIDQLKGLAVGTLFGVAKDILTRSLPKPMEGQINEVVDGLTLALGGKPIRGHVLSERPPQAARPATASYTPTPSSAT
jgi:ElaB/YqjD/DUF883 family membrane-anchored ribosome-binding protein